MSAGSGVRVERRGAALVAVIDRPDAKNAIDLETAQALEAFVQRASAEDEVRVAIITGAGQDVFVSGGDLRAFDAFKDDPMGATRVLEMSSTTHAIETCEVPVIAALQGTALGGGCELSLACDMVVIEEHARMMFRQAAMGLSTGWGGGTRLIERVGPMVAAKVLLLGASVTAQEALALGLVTEVAPKGTSCDRALVLAERVARLPRASVAGLKRMIREVRQARRGDSFAREADVFASLWGGPDHLAAMDAFFKRS